MLAICIGKYFKISEENIKASIEEYTPSNNRSEIIETEKNTVILDAYNANPSSMQAMIKSFAKQKYAKKICILGDMLELGASSVKEHQKIFDLTKKLKLECVFIGNEFSKVSKIAYKNRSDFETYLQQNPKAKRNFMNKTILLKGSRGVELEKLKYLL